MALLSQAKSESKTLDSPEDERQKQLKTAREIISNAIGDETVGKKTNRLCMGKTLTHMFIFFLTHQIFLFHISTLQVESHQFLMEAVVAALLVILV